LIISVAEGYVFAAQGDAGLGASPPKAGARAFASALPAVILAGGSPRGRGNFTIKLAELGKTSYFIYLCHLNVPWLLPPPAIRYAPTKAGAILIAIAATVAICFAASRVMRAALGPETSSRVFGA
jgi:peptidoglycan/LPS O-acetylase OafA/YrhL